MMSLKNFCRILLLVLCCSNGYAQTKYRLSVEELFERGVTNSLSVKSSQVNVAIAKSDREDKRMDRFPDINVGLVGGYIGEPKTFGRGDVKTEHKSMPDWSQNYSVDATQLLYQGGKLKLIAERADVQTRIANLGVERTVAEIKLILIDGYLQLFQLYKQRDVIEKSIEEAQQRLHDIRSMAKNGMITESDVLRSELQLSEYELTLIEISNNIKIVSQQLDIALGLDEELILVPEGDIIDKSYDILSYDAYIGNAYQNYPELKIAKSYVEVADKNSRIAKADYFPKLSVKVGNIMARPITSTAQDLYSNNWNVGLSLSYSLSSLYHNKRKVDIAKYSVELQRIEEERTKQTIRSEVKANYIKHGESLERIKTLLISVEQAKENYRIVLNKYRHSLAILTDLLDASSVLLTAEMQLTSAKSNAVYTYYKLLRSTGTI